jgi:ribonuclease HI
MVQDKEALEMHLVVDLLETPALNLGTHTTIYTELVEAMKAIEIAFSHSWLKLWLETDSKLVVLAFKNSSVIPWQLKNIWCNCLSLTSNMSFVVSHIYREDDQIEDTLANLGFSLQSPMSDIVFPIQS